MQLKLIQQYAAAYAEWLLEPTADVRLYYWETQRQWQDHFDLAAPSLIAGYTAGLNNSRNRRLWNREGYEPKFMMLEFMALEHEFVRSMWLDLYNEQKDVVGRADRFVFYCDQLLNQYIDHHARPRHTRHYHDDDYHLISLYLSFQYPALYAPYRAERLRPLLQRLGVGNLPVGGDFERHHKVMRTLYQLLVKENTVWENHQARLHAKHHYQGESLLLAFDFAEFILSSPQPASSSSSDNP